MHSLISLKKPREREGSWLVLLFFSPVFFPLFSRLAKITRPERSRFLCGHGGHLFNLGAIRIRRNGPFFFLFFFLWRNIFAMELAGCIYMGAAFRDHFSA